MTAASSRPDLILDQDGTFIGWRGARRARALRAVERIAVAVDALIAIGDGCWRRIWLPNRSPRIPG
jgi:hypothetical protein